MMFRLIAKLKAGGRRSVARLERQRITTWTTVVVAAFVAKWVSWQPVIAESSDRPNIVLIMADDIGVEGIGAYGGRSYRTPSIDRLARDGIRFTQAYAQPLCTNTRIQLMTGLYNHRNWMAFGILDPKAKTIGHWMSGAGYRCLIAGKWQLQSYDPPDYPGAASRRGIGMHPRDAGFDEYVLWHTAHTEDKGSRYADPLIIENGKRRPNLEAQYGPAVWVEAINDFIRRHQDEPFFVYYPMALPHWPFMPTPDSDVWSDPDQRSIERLEYFPDMVEYMDKAVGQIVDQIDRLGLGENTLILFYSDNGTHLKVTSQTREGPIAGGKGMTTDAGTHVPLVARWTGRIRPGVNDDLVDSTDFIPTILEAAGRPLPSDHGLDGRSFYPRLLGQAGQPRSWIYCHFDPRPGWDKDRFRLLRFARDKRFKLYDDGRMYDVPSDPLEQRPLAADAGGHEARDARPRLQRVLDEMIVDPD